MGTAAALRIQLRETLRLLVPVSGQFEEKPCLTVCIALTNPRGQAHPTPCDLHVIGSELRDWKDRAMPGHAPLGWQIRQATMLEHCPVENRPDVDRASMIAATPSFLIQWHVTADAAE